MKNYDIDTLLTDAADVGHRMWHIGAAEGAAGNLSIFVRELGGVPGWSQAQRQIELPIHVPALEGGWLIISGSGKRIRDIATRPKEVICLLQIIDGGRNAALHAPEGLRPTTELNSHLATHDDHVARRGLEYHALLHAQPLRLTYLSHIERYCETTALTRQLLRWQPETIIEFPEGLAVIRFQPPASSEQAEATAQALQRYRAVVWARHGIVTRADASIGKAGDLVEYAEAAARYEYLNLSAGEPASGLSSAELQQMCERLGIEQRVF